MPYLISVGGETPGQRLPLKPGANLVGRGRESDIVVLHGSVSRQHARLDVEADRILMTDLNSRNGCSVDGLKVQRSRLKHGDTVQFGDVKYLVEDEREVARAQVLKRATMDLSGMLALDGEQRTSALKIRMVEPERRAEEKLRLLLTVSQFLSSPTSLDSLLPKVFDLLFQILEVDRAALLLSPEEGSEALEPVLIRANKGSAGPAPIYSQNIVQHVFKKGSSVLAGDATIDPRFKESASVMANAIRSTMCVPLKVQEKVVGVLYVDNLSVANRYSEEDLEFLEAFASAAGIAIDNSRMAKKLQNEAVVKSALLRFFPPAMVGPLMSSPDFGREPRDVEVTVLFSDISGFTAMSSKMRSRQIVELLNRYFPVMAGIVFKYNGTLEKYIGDALMAIWGTPEPQEDDADRALEAAIEMQSALQKFNSELSGLPPLSIHIGLNSGPVTFGNIGSADYVQFAAIGDTTNVASRVCNLANAGEIVLSDVTAGRLTRGRVPLIEMPPALVKGKEHPLKVYRVGSQAPAVDATWTNAPRVP
ncbi:MAG: GAF domain-containing protein [Thermoanaerobaculia bacterium]|nr:hypothetical protein [Thermoanaerobaculia bacterium]MCK6683217.1 GAF domain-containing protein [Thermoanaerobaculia bacterium]